MQRGCEPLASRLCGNDAECGGSEMRVLGLDPGLRHTGWGVIDVAGNRLSYVADGVAHAPTDLPLAERLVALFRQVIDVLERFRPDEAAVEETGELGNHCAAFQIRVVPA